MPPPHHNLPSRILIVPCPHHHAWFAAHLACPAPHLPHHNLLSVDAYPPTLLAAARHTAQQRGARAIMPAGKRVLALRCVRAVLHSRAVMTAKKAALPGRAGRKETALNKRHLIGRPLRFHERIHMTHCTRGAGGAKDVTMDALARAPTPPPHAAHAHTRCTHAASCAAHGSLPLRVTFLNTSPTHHALPARGCHLVCHYPSRGWETCRCTIPAAPRHTHTHHTLPPPPPCWAWHLPSWDLRAHPMGCKGFYPCPHTPSRYHPAPPSPSTMP